MEHTRREDDVERASLETRPRQIGLDELNPIQSEAPRGRRAEQQRSAGQVCGDDDAIGPGEIEGHLTGSASDLDDPRVAGNRLIHETSEGTALGPRVKRLQAVTRWVAGKGRAIVEAPHPIGARVAWQSETGNSVRRVEARAAPKTRPVVGERARARRTG